MTKKIISEDKNDIFGNDYIKHTNESGKLTGTSYVKEDLFGNKYVEHRGADNPVAGSIFGGLGKVATIGTAAIVVVPVSAIGVFGAFAIIFPFVLIGLYILVPVTIAVFIPTYLGKKFRLPNYGLYYYFSMGLGGGYIVSLTAAAEGEPWGIFSWIVWILIWPVGTVVAYFLDSTGRDTATLATLLLMAAAIVALIASLITKRRMK